jgi:hypothetical protein
MKGGNQVELEKISDNLKVIQQQVEDAMQTIKTSTNSSTNLSTNLSTDLSTNSDNDFYGIESSMPNKSEEITPQVNTSSASDYSAAVKPWQDDKNMKFQDGNGGRVSLSFPRIIMLIQGNINKNNTSKAWGSIKEQLLDATTLNQVKSIISENKLNFSANSVLGGTKKRRRYGRRVKTSKRR